MRVSLELAAIIEEMMWEFMDSRLEVEKVRSKTHEGSFNLIPITSNPEWYQKMCSDFPRPVQPSNPRIKHKKQRTIVKREYTVRVFELLLKNLQSSSKYASYIIGEAERRLESYSGGSVPWDNQF